MKRGVTTPAVLERIVIRSEGQRMLMAVTGALEAIAAELGATRQAVHLWKTGDRTPSVVARARIQEAFGIPARAWTVKPGDMPAASPAAAVAATAAAVVDKTRPTTLEHVFALLDIIANERATSTLLSSEQVKLVTAEAGILQLRVKLEEAAQYAEARYVTGHPSWLRLKRGIVKALEPYPEAARAVAAAIEAIDKS